MPALRGGWCFRLLDGGCLNAGGMESDGLGSLKTYSVLAMPLALYTRKSIFRLPQYTNCLNAGAMV